MGIKMRQASYRMGSETEHALECKATYEAIRARLESEGVVYEELEHDGDKVLVVEKYQGAVIRKYESQGHWESYDKVDVYDEETDTIKAIQVGGWSRSQGMGWTNHYGVTEVGKLSPSVQDAVDRINKQKAEERALARERMDAESYAARLMAPQRGDRVRYTGRKTKSAKPGDEGKIFWIQDDRIGFKVNPDDRNAPAHWVNWRTGSGNIQIEYLDPLLERLGQHYPQDQLKRMLALVRKHLPDHPLLHAYADENESAVAKLMRIAERKGLTLTPLPGGKVQVDAEALLTLLVRV